MAKWSPLSCRLWQVNHAPSFATESELDHQVKHEARCENLEKPLGHLNYLGNFQSIPVSGWSSSVVSCRFCLIHQLIFASKL